jgi:translocation and assembly module TamB
MTRRRLVALVSAAVLFVIGSLVFATGLYATRTATGRDRILEFVKPFIARAVPGGTLYLGHWSGNLITNLTFDSVAIRDKRGELFLSTGRVTVEYNWRDLIDDRIYIRRARVEHPFVHVVQHTNGVWNFKQIFASTKPSPPKPRTPETRNFGDYIVIDSATARDGTFLLTLPWQPDDSLHGARRDSAVRVHLTNAAKAVARTYDGFGRTYAWRKSSALVSHIRLADPDSDKFGQLFQVASISADEYEPTFQFRNVKGEARHLGDSVWFESPHFDLPASTGRGRGKVWWGNDRPVRYDVAIRGDSVSLDDVNWVYPTLPRVGGGSVNLLIKNDPKNEKVVEFKLVKMDVQSTKSHLTGEMEFGIGAPVLLVRGVDLRADPVDFDLLRTLNGKKFPTDWQGQLFGTVRGPGGPLTHFVVDDAQATFEDAHVRGAVSRVGGKGELDILYPAFTAFHGFDVDAQSIDLRSIEYLFPSFPRLKGFVSGTATLDSSWLDVRFSDAQVTHTDGPGEPSRVTGSGRVTYGEKYMTYDLSLQAEPLSLPTLSRTYAFLPPHGLLSGPIQAQGSTPDLAVTLALRGDQGALTYDGRVDLDSISGYAARGRGQFSALDVGALFQKPLIPVGNVSGHYAVDLTGQSAATLRGSANVDIERTMLDSVRVYPSVARVHFGDGRMTVDSMRLHTAGFTAVASGAIGLPKGSSDSLSFTVTVDSLGGLRPYFPRPDTTLLGAAATPADSLSGKAELKGVATGTFDVLNLRGSLDGENIYINKDRGEHLIARFDVRNVLHSPAGRLDVSVDTVRLGGVALDTIGGVLHFEDAKHARFEVGALSRNGPTASGGGAWRLEQGTHSVSLDSLLLAVGTDRWWMERPAHLALDSAGRRLDSLVLRNRGSAVVVLSGNVPNAGPAVAHLRASGVPLRDVGTFEQLADTLSGIGALSISATGTKNNPQINATATLAAVNWSGVDVDSVVSTAQYHDRRVDADLDIVRKARTAVSAHASLPANITLFGIRPVNDSIRGFVHADTTDLSLIKPLFGKLQPTLTGRLAASVTASGTMRKPIFDGSLLIADGTAKIDPLGIKLESINGRVTGGTNISRQDSINVSLAAKSDHGSVWAGGWIRNLTQSRGGGSTAFSLKLAADSLLAFDKRSIAKVYLSTRRDTLRLTGTIAAASLTGSINVDKASIFIADRDLARKQTFEFISDATKVDSTGPSALLSTLMTNLNMNVPVRFGQDVRLQSNEANVRLAGQLTLGPSTDRSTRTLASTGQFVPRLSLEGQLRTVSGTYNLNLGLVQREFDVLPEGTVTFDGPTSTPLVDIKAQYNVKQVRDRDIGVIVNLKGRMPSPKIDFSSNVGYEIPQSDLLSYLIIGRPGFDFGANAPATQVLASFLSPTVSAVAADRLRSNLGSWLDVFSFELGTSVQAENTSFFSNKNLSQYLYGSTIGAGQQITRNLYLGVNTGLCQLQSRLSLGAQVEYRFDPRLSMRLGYDPATVARTCGTEQELVVGTVATPPNWSLGLFHTWRF